ncbi:hypothetical protein GKZ28_15390 [Clostridium chromiireducens]|uniref:Uncharacterized protein n=1 Tax=Clostridium chromiireducens TaxID=225345 RepID=A0A964RNZ2_9CLOT|nr:hypothetical protein [Clostridium chromiireducens]MVX65073.1 hypothetical protein [Clostridium chromiireducens]
MRNLKMKIEKETKTRINIIGSANSYKKMFLASIIKPRILFEKDSIDLNTPVSFPTEILCSASENNNIVIYLALKNEENLISELKDNILKALHETYSKIDVINEDENSILKNIEKRFQDNFIEILNKFYGISLSKYYGIDDIMSEMNEDIDFTELFEQIKKLNDLKDISEEKDDYIWELYFNKLEISLKNQYYKWSQLISKYYIHRDEGYEYINEDQENSNNYINKDLENLCKALYGIRSSCSLMIDRVYMEIPSKKEQFSGVVFIDYLQSTKCNNLTRLLEERICEDYKEVFLFNIESNKDINSLSVLKEKISSETLNNRLFCIITDGSYVKEQILKFKEKWINNDFENLTDLLKSDVSKKIGISKDKIAGTMQLNELHKDSLENSCTNSDFIELVKLIQKESESYRRTIKIKSKNKENIINISLNQERMSVQALVSMLYERYNGYLVEVWNGVISNRRNCVSCYSKNKIIIRNRKDNYQNYILCCDEEEKHIIDFSLKSGDNKDSKKILKLLLNYGYNIVGFDSTENKIIVNVNGEISKEDKEKLVKSIKGRLEESAINYFENSFLMEVTKNKFNTNNLHKALEIEKNITIDDFYSAFQEAFRKISDNILRYEVILQSM